MTLGRSASDGADRLFRALFAFDRTESDPLCLSGIVLMLRRGTLRIDGASVLGPSSAALYRSGAAFRVNTIGEQS